MPHPDHVAGDTATGADIYHWRFAPRASTKRNTEWYFWAWIADSIPWGNQVQDGGAVLGFSFHDVMSRLALRGPDDAAGRLGQILDWYAEAVAAGGVRAYYAADPSRGALQGGGTAGGLGIDVEFLETVLLPHTMIEGFLGFQPTPDGLRLAPALPRDWPSLRVEHIHYRGGVWDVTATGREITLHRNGSNGDATGRLKLFLPKGQWTLARGEQAAAPLDAAGGDDAGVEVEIVPDGTPHVLRRVD